MKQPIWKRQTKGENRRRKMSTLRQSTTLAGKLFRHAEVLSPTGHWCRITADQTRIVRLQTGVEIRQTTVYE